MGIYSWFIPKVILEKLTISMLKQMLLIFWMEVTRITNCMGQSPP